MTVPVFTIPTVSLPDVAMLDTSEPLCPSAYPIDRQIGYPEIIDESQKYPTFAAPWQDRFNDVTISSTIRARPEIKGYFATLNGMTIYDLMDHFIAGAGLYSSSEALCGEGYGDAVLMRKMITRVLSDSGDCEHLGDVYVSRTGTIQAYTLSGLQSVGTVNLTGDWSVPRWNIGVFVSNSPNADPPPSTKVSIGDFWFKTFNGTAPGFFIYRFDSRGGWIKLDETSTDVVRFDKHIEISMSKFPSSGGYSFVTSSESSSSVSSTSEISVVDVNWYAATIAKYRESYTNAFSMALTGADTPTTFVMDVNSLLPASPMRVSSFSGSFSFVLLNSGDVEYCSYVKKVYESSTAPYFFSGHPLPAEFHGLTYNPPSGRSEFRQQKTVRGSRSVYTFSVPYSAAGSAERGYEMALAATTVVPYRSVNRQYQIDGGYLQPEAYGPGGPGTVYRFPGLVTRTNWEPDQTLARIYDNANLTYTSGDGAFSLVSPKFNTDSSEYFKWIDHGPEYKDDAGRDFPDRLWVLGLNDDLSEYYYDTESINVGLGLRVSEVSGLEETTVIL